MKNLNSAFALIICAAFLSVVVGSPTKLSKPSSPDAPTTEKTSYKGFKVIRVYTDGDQSTFNFLTELHSAGNVDFWRGPFLDRPSDIAVAPDMLHMLKTLLHIGNVRHKVFIHDVQKLIDSEVNQRLKLKSKKYQWKHYQSLDEIYSWLDEIQTANPDLVQVRNFAKSSEGREIKLVQISTTSVTPAGKRITSNNRTVRKKAAFIDAGIHAREWISPAVNTFIINQLLNRNSSDVSPSLLEEFDFYFIPVVNPDGYEFSFKSDRLWRKTRSKTWFPFCKGVDGNRNYDNHFLGAGSSINPCNITYAGANAFSEPETRAVRDVLLSRPFDLYISLHSYSQIWLTPWSYSMEFPQNYEELKRVAGIGAKALTNVHGTEYQFGHSGILLGTTAGSSDDWALATAGVRYPFTIELRDKGEDEGGYGFLLPPEQIIPTGEETWAGIEAVLKELSTNIK